MEAPTQQIVWMCLMCDEEICRRWYPDFWPPEVEERLDEHMQHHVEEMADAAR